MAVDRKKILLRLKPSNYEKLKTIAEKNNRALSNQIEYLIEQHIENYETQNGKLNVVNVQQGDNNTFQNSISEA